jgi:hypothetical protein
MLNVSETKKEIHLTFGFLQETTRYYNQIVYSTCSGERFLPTPDVCFHVDGHLTRIPPPVSQVTQSLGSGMI